jgi:hypothetical protein
MITREELEKLQDEMAKRDLVSFASTDEVIAYKKSFTAALDLLWPVIETSERLNKRVIESDRLPPSIEALNEHLRMALSELKERVK